jgi:uncharacterized protein
MGAVSNTSPISSLAIIGRLELLKSQFSEVWISAAVFQELSAHPDPLASAAIQAAIQEAWIKAVPIPSSGLVDALSLHLHRGEAETIALALNLKTEIVIIDEQEGRQLAIAIGLQVTGTLGILLRAKQIGQIPALKLEVEALRNKARFFIAPSLEAKLLAAADE